MRLILLSFLCSIALASGGGSIGGGGSSGLAIGGAVSGGGANKVLFEDASQNLAASSLFKYDPTAGSNLGQLTVPSGQETNSPPYYGNTPGLTFAGAAALGRQDGIGWKDNTVEQDLTFSMNGELFFWLSDPGNSTRAIVLSQTLRPSSGRDVTLGGDSAEAFYRIWAHRYIARSSNFSNTGFYPWLAGSDGTYEGIGVAATAATGETVDSIYLSTPRAPDGSTHATLILSGRTSNTNVWAPPRDTGAGDGVATSLIVSGANHTGGSAGDNGGTLTLSGGTASGSGTAGSVALNTGGVDRLTVGPTGTVSLSADLTMPGALTNTNTTTVPFQATHQNSRPIYGVVGNTTGGIWMNTSDEIFLRFNSSNYIQVTSGNIYMLSPDTRRRAGSDDNGGLFYTSNPASTFATTTQVGNTAATLTDAGSYTLGASQLGTNKSRFRCRYTGTFAATISTDKQIKAIFGSTTLFDSGSIAVTSANNWVLEVECLRHDSTHAKCGTNLSTSYASLPATAAYVNANETLTNALAMKLQIGGTNASDTTMETAECSWSPAP